MRDLKLKVIICIILLILFGLLINPVSGIGGATDHLTNPSPYYGEGDVSIGAKGVQTCIDVTVEGGCTVNLTFQWYNYSGGDIGEWDNYGEVNDQAVSGQVCFWNANVSCATENWWSEYHHWRVVGNFTCQQTDYQEIAYMYFNPQDCPLFYIYPTWNGTGICPCCDAMCVGFNNTNGNNMNITWYRNDSQFEAFYVVNELINVPNGTYCFCIDGHINSTVEHPYRYYPMRYNETYYWYVNITDVVTGEYNISDIYHFTTAVNLSDCYPGTETSIVYKSERDTMGIIGIIGLMGLLAFFLRRRQ